MPKKKSPKFEQAEALMKLVSDSLTKTDFTTSFKGVVDYVKRVDINLTNNFKNLSKTLTDKANEIKVNHKKTEDLQERLNARVLSLKDGKTPIKNVDYFDGAPGLPGNNGSPDTPYQIKDKLGVLEGEDRLSIGHIHGLEEALAEGRKPRIADMTAIGVNRPQMTYIDLSPQLNGVLTTFNTQSFQKIIQISLSSYPNILRPGIDFTFGNSPPSITFIGQVAIDAATVLSTGQTCIVLVLA